MKENLRFVDKDHKEFYRYTLYDLEGAEGPYTRPVVYLLSASSTTREYFWDIYDNRIHGIRVACLYADWQTPESRLLIALACVLSGDPSATVAAGGTLAPAIIDALYWSDKVDAIMGNAPAVPPWMLGEEVV